jgi:LmbE family N-acetylglucosaminyl deacetylase
MDQPHRSHAKSRTELGSGVGEKLQLEGVENALVIVAHPDDETIWMGGTIARYAAIHWTIFVLCRKSDPDRMPKFMRVAKYYKARGIICDLEDEGIMSLSESVPKIQSIIKRELPKEQFDCIFTHGGNGEYGHRRHKGVHLAVKQMIRRGDLKAKQHFCFAYQLNKQKKVAFPRQNARYFLELSNKEWKAKRSVVKRLYGFLPHIFENRSCSKVETFTR